MKATQHIDPNIVSNTKKCYYAGFQDALHGRPMQEARYGKPDYQQSYEDGYARAIELERRHDR